MPEAACRPLAEGVSLSVRLTPKGGRDAVDGFETLSDGSRVLAVRVRAVPQDGEANRALTRVLAKALDVSMSRIAVTKGATSRVKVLTIMGETDTLMRRVAGLVTSLVLLMLLGVDARAQQEPAQSLRSLQLGPLDVCSSRTTFLRTRAMVFRTGKPGPERARRLRVLRVGEDLAETGCRKRDFFLVRRATGMVNNVNREIGLPPIDLPTFVVD